jgi:hypothetical protein
MKGLPIIFATATVCAATHQQANPIRKVVTMLQAMQKKVEAEGEKEQEMFEKFMCYCKNSGGTLEKAISENEAKSGEMPAEIEEGEATLKQTKEDLKKDQSDRAAAKMALEEATGIREKESATFAKESGDLKTNVAAVKKAVAAMEGGAAAGFLQTASAGVIKNLVENDTKMLDVDRQDLTSFLSGSSDYGGPSDAIVGILKQMGDTMATNLEEITGAEKDAKASYEQLVKAKTAEVDALTASIEERTKRIGELGVQLVEMREELSDAEESLVEDKKFLAELEKGCSTKEKEWAEICKVRQEEILALADTIKILNDDDALEMFKKALPGASSFVQIEVSQDDLRSRALSFLQTARGSKQHDRQRLDLVMLALRGKKVGFEKVIKLIDDMVALMKKEQQDDADKKEYCETSLDQADDKKKELERAEGKLGKAMNEAKEQIAQLADDIKELGAGIVALDKDVAEATENRKEENSDFKTLFANDAAAKEILEFAKNRLNKFYNPKMYKPPAGGELVQVHAHDAPPPPPETAKAYQKKGEEGGGVIAMIDTLVKELDTEMTEAETNEKLAQEDYEEMMSDSSDKRAADSKSLADKDAAKGDLSNKLVELGDEHKATIAELMATEKYIGDLHGECDWLLKYFDVRKTARTGEIEALGKAKAVLNGADFGFLLQTKTSKFLRKA